MKNLSIFAGKKLKSSSSETREILKTSQTVDHDLSTDF